MKPSRAMSKILKTLEEINARLEVIELGIDDLQAQSKKASKPKKGKTDVKD